MAMSSIDVRDLRFDLSEVPRDWHPKGAAVTAFWDQFSVFFPVGEAFFVRSVRHFLPRLDDPRLAADVAAFCAQEGHHAREHRAYNDHLQAQGLPISTLEGVVRRLLGLSQRFSPTRQLAITCALEHFTSLMGEAVLSHEPLLAGAHPTMMKLWRWHAAEENEHRSVAFDVYQAIGGTRAGRARAMVSTTLIFWALVSLQSLVFLWNRGALFSPRELWRLFSFVWLDPKGLRTLFGPWWEYFAADFHPSKRGNALVDAWKREYAAAS